MHGTAVTVLHQAGKLAGSGAVQTLCVRACVRARARACVRVCVCVCVCVCVWRGAERESTPGASLRPQSLPCTEHCRAVSHRRSLRRSLRDYLPLTRCQQVRSWGLAAWQAMALLVFDRSLSKLRCSWPLQAALQALRWPLSQSQPRLQSQQGFQVGHALAACQQLSSPCSESVAVLQA